MNEAMASQVVADVRDVLSHLPWLPHVQCTALWQGLHGEDEAGTFLSALSVGLCGCRLGLLQPADGAAHPRGCMELPGCVLTHKPNSRNTKHTKDLY